MAKKKAAAAEEFNLSALVREALTLDPKTTPQAVQEFIIAKHPSAAINKGSFSVAFYTMRKKLGIKSGKRRGRRVAIRTGRTAMAGGGKVGNGKIDMLALQAAARLIRDVGGAEAAIEAIKSVQAVQVK